MAAFVIVKFRPDDRRTYTYRNPGFDVAIGDEVKVPDNRQDGWKRVTVVDLNDDEPAFACKDILGKAEPEGLV